VPDRDVVADDRVRVRPRQDVRPEPRLVGAHHRAVLEVAAAAHRDLARIPCRQQQHRRSGQCWNFVASVATDKPHAAPVGCAEAGVTD